MGAEWLAPPDPMGDDSWAPQLASIGDQPAALPAIVYAELLVGVELADSPRRAAARRTRIDALTAHASLVEFDADIARIWARLFADANRAGRRIPAHDLAVAATAIHLANTVLVGSSDENYFRTIEGLRLETLRRK